MGIDLGNLAALRTFRVLRALKTVAIVPGKLNTTPRPKHNKKKDDNIFCLFCYAPQQNPYNL
jgi:hypothetical protein